jgi:hypothetical protein
MFQQNLQDMDRYMARPSLLPIVVINQGASDAQSHQQSADQKQDAAQPHQKQQAKPTKNDKQSSDSENHDTDENDID